MSNDFQLAPNTLIFLMGPTASGKTSLAINLARYFPVEIISVDSALVYRGLDIGSAKPTKEEREAVPHHLIDICDPSESFSAADFCDQVQKTVVEITERGKIPVLAGGTMMYFRVFLDGLAQMPEADEQIRAQIESVAQELGWTEIHRRLAEVDPQTAAEIHPNHSQRLSRAYEVYLSSGKTMSQLRAVQPKENSFLLNYQIIQLAICPKQRATLHQRIEQRLRQMVAHGFVEEVEKLFRRGDLNEKLPAIRAVGYRQFWNYCAGECSLDDATEKAIIATRQLAKRQLTWLRGWKDPLYWLYTQEESGENLNDEQILFKALRILDQFAI